MEVEGSKQASKEIQLQKENFPMGGNRSEWACLLLGLTINEFT